jgi:hypothetical protein
MKNSDTMWDAEPEDDETGLSGTQPSEDGAQTGNGQALGFILDEPNEKKVAKHVVELREAHSAARSRHRATWKQNGWWREGRRWVRIEKAQDQNLWRAWLPPGMSSAPPVPNKTDRLCRRVVNTVLVDKPFPECEPAGDKATDKDAAEFATRYLSVRGSSAELDLNDELRAAADTAMTFASAFAWVTMDPHAGGHRPRTVIAHPNAETADDPLTDPETGEPANEDEVTERYQTPDGTLSDDPAQADLQWLPNHKIRLLTGLQVDLLPATARNLRDAVGIVITDTTTLGDLRAQFGDVIDGLSDDQLNTLCTWRPTKVEDILPAYTKEPEDQKDKDSGKYKDSQMVVATTAYYRSCAEYPLGAYAVIGGDSLVLHRQKWTAMMPQPMGDGGQDAPPKEQCLMLPVAHCRCLNDHVTNDPYGIGLAEKLGPADEIRASAFAHELEHMFRAANPHVLLPVGTIVQPGRYKQRDGEPLYFNPQGRPEWENVPTLSNTVPELRGEMTAEMDDESGLQQAAQGVESPTVKSGIHAQTIVQEALKAVMEIKDNLGTFYVRLNQIILEHARAYLTVPQLLQYVGTDGQYKAKEFSRVDFGTTRIVSIAKGSYTMHTLAAKQELAANMFDRKVIDQDEYNDLLRTSGSPLIGLQDNPALLRVRRQIEAYREGPTPEWTQAFQEFTAEMEQYQAAQPQMQQRAQILAAQGIQSPPVPPPVKPPGPFDPRLPVDDEPMPAKIRHRAIAAEMQSSSFDVFPPEWRQVLLDTYMLDKNAAGVMTVPDVQKQQAAQLAAMPPALPKGVSIAMKGDASSVAEEEQAALQGFQGSPVEQTHQRDATGAVTQTATKRTPPAMVTDHERDHTGAIVRSVTRRAE